MASSPSRPKFGKSVTSNYGAPSSPGGFGKAGFQVAPSSAKNVNSNIPGSTPTHVAFAQQAKSAQSGGAGFGQGSSAPKAAPTIRQGAIYGALESLQAATNTLKDTDDSANNTGNLLNKDLQGGRKGPSAHLTPEQLWQSIPSGGEAAWKLSNTKQSQRLKVARLQEALSEAAAGLQKATDAVKGGADEDIALGAASLGHLGPTAALRQECVVLEAEAKELEEEKAFLDARVLEVKKELARVREALGPNVQRAREASPEPEAPSEQNAARTTADVSELAVVLRLLACLKDLALTNRSTILPADPSRWTREQQVVAYFLDEVEACQSRLDAY